MTEAIVGFEIGLDRFSRYFQIASTKNPPRVEGRRFPLGCSQRATSAFTNHLAREGQVGLGVDPNLDAILHPISLMKSRQ